MRLRRRVAAAAVLMMGLIAVGCTSPEGEVVEESAASETSVSSVPDPTASAVEGSSTVASAPAVERESDERQMTAASWIQLLGTIVSLVSAVVAAISAMIANARSRRRETYGEAYKVAMEWSEMPFRIVRSTEKESDDLRHRFHELQESLYFYRGWIATESKAVAQSYGDLVSIVKEVTGPAIKQAKLEIGKPGAASQLPKCQDEIAPASEAFLEDVRNHLSLWSWKHRKIGERMKAIQEERRSRED